MQRKELETYINEYLEVSRFRDYCPNGVQVEGRDEIYTIITGVTASLEFLQAAADAGADAALVHHGYFWRGEDPRVVGVRRKRLAFLLERDINLFAYHLPLDVHPGVGNNAQLARLLGLRPNGTFGEYDVGIIGVPTATTTLDALTEQIALALEHDPLVIGDGAREIHNVAWSTGASQRYFEDAIAAGADVFISGEISEQTVHLANESGVAYIAAGHHATERYGIAALGDHLAERFGLTHRFIDIPNPV